MQTPKSMNVQAEHNIFLLHSSRIVFQTFFFFGVEEELAEAMCSGVPSPRLSPFAFFPPTL